MSQKAECPACKAYLSGVWDALTGRRESCPSCGLPGSVIREVEAAREARANAELTGKLEEALVRAGKAEGELARLRGRLYKVRQMFAEWDRKEPLDSEEWRAAEWWDED
jgi:hypothetical protein